MNHITLNLFKKATIAGVLIGLGDIIYALTSNPVIGSLLFSFGLLSVIALRLPLYTGKIGYTDGKDTLPLLVILIGNFIGVAFVVFLSIRMDASLIDTLQSISDKKFEKGFMEMFVCGIFCGMLIHFAVKIKQSITTVMAIMIFILIGSEHCVAIFPYAVITFSWIGIAKLMLIVLGNSIGSIFIERFIE